MRMTKDEARERARNNFLSGLNCTQSVVAVFAEELGFDSRVLAVAQPFGAGICRMREVCGTVSGMMMCLGMSAGSPTADKAAKDAVYAHGQKLAAEFKASTGSLICAELLGLAHGAEPPTSEERTAGYYKKRPCPELCALAAGIVWEHLRGRGVKDGAQGADDNPLSP